MASNGPNTRSASPAAADAKRLSLFVRNLGMAVLLPVPADSTIGNRRYRSNRLRSGRPRRSPMTAVLHDRKKGEAHETHRLSDRWSWSILESAPRIWPFYVAKFHFLA